METVFYVTKGVFTISQWKSPPTIKPALMLIGYRAAIQKVKDIKTCLVRVPYPAPDGNHDARDQIADKLTGSLDGEPFGQTNDRRG